MGICIKALYAESFTVILFLNHRSPALCHDSVWSMSPFTCMVNKTEDFSDLYMGKSLKFSILFLTSLRFFLLCGII